MTPTEVWIADAAVAGMFGTVCILIGMVLAVLLNRKRNQ